MNQDHNTQKMRHAKQHNRLHKGLRILCAVVFILGLLGLGAYWLRQYQAQKVYDGLKDQSQSQSQTASSVAATPAPTAGPTAAPAIPVDFDSLQAQNPDAYAWISIPGTLVDYPMMQNAKNTDYYLDHTFDHKYGLPGAIYTRNDTAQDFSDPCTVVYGHNMKNDTMFGSLHEYAEAEFFNDPANRTIYTYSPGVVREWTIFAAVEYSDVLLSAAYNFEDPQQMEAFLESLSNSHGRFDEEIPVDGSSRIIVLSTCVSGNRDTVRYLVVGVLTDERQVESAG